MESSNMAHLDRSENKVLCCKCHREIAHVLTDQDNFLLWRHGKYERGARASGVRVLHFDIGWQPHEYGIWQLTQRALRQMKRGKQPTVRRQWKPVYQSLNDELESPDERPVDETYKQLAATFVGLRFVRRVYVFPAKAQCWRCGTTQVLDAGALNVTDLGRACCHFLTGEGYIDPEEPLEPLQFEHNLGRQFCSTTIRHLEFTNKGVILTVDNS